MPDGFVWVCAQAVCEAIEHIHAEIGIAHNNVRMSSVLFDVGGRIRLGDPLPLLVRNALDGKVPQFLPSNGQGRDMKTQQEEQEACTVFKSNLCMAMANDVRNTGEMILELVTLRTIAEHGNVQHAMNHAKEMDKNKSSILSYLTQFLLVDQIRAKKEEADQMHVQASPQND